MFTDRLQGYVLAGLDDQFIVDVTDDEALTQGLHGVGKDVPTDSLHDVFGELRTIRLDPGPLLFGVNSHVSDRLATEFVLPDLGFHVGELSAGGKGDEEHPVSHYELDVADLGRDAQLDRGLYCIIDLPPMVRRANLETGTGKKRIYSGKYALSSIVFCAHCGDVFQRTHWNVHGRKKIVWRCISRLHKKDRDFDCPARTVTEADLHAAVVVAVNEVHAHQDAYLPQLKINIEKAITKNNNGPVAELDGKIADLEQEILKRTRARQDCDDLGQEVIRLREEKYQLQLEDASKETLRQKIVALETVLAGVNGKVEEYEDALVRKLIERITVYDEYYTVEFKSGIEIDVRL